jgi:flavin-dependent dehydrogenase
MGPFVRILGGGIAGQVLQKELQLRGIPSHLEDRSPFPRDKVCGGVLQPDSWKYLSSVFKIDTPVRKIKVLSQYYRNKRISTLRLADEMVIGFGSKTTPRPWKQGKRASK